MARAADLYPLGTKLRILKVCTGRHSCNAKVGDIGIVVYGYCDGDVDLTTDGHLRGGENDLGYYSSDEVEPVVSTYHSPFNQGDIVIINPSSYRGGQRAQVVEWTEVEGVSEPVNGKTMVAHLPLDGDYTSYLNEYLTLEIKSPPKLVGRIYFPTDNSYAKCLNDREWNYRLAGFDGFPSHPAEQTTIVLEPFTARVVREDGSESDYQMVVVQCLRGHYHQVLFSESGLKP